jgi:hypothetical protein
MSDSYYDRTLLYFFSFLFFMLCLYTWAIPFREIFGLETRNALITREMLDGGLTIIPHAMGRPYPDYPPLFFWTAALFSMPFGQVTPLSVAMPSTLSALGLVALSFRFFLFMAGIFSVYVLCEIVAVWLHGGGAELIRNVIHAQVMALSMHSTAPASRRRSNLSQTRRSCGIFPVLACLLVLKKSQISYVKYFLKRCLKS